MTVSDMSELETAHNMDRLLVGGRGGDSAGGENAADEILGDGLRKEGAARVSSL